MILASKFIHTSFIIFFFATASLGQSSSSGTIDSKIVSHIDSTLHDSYIESGPGNNFIEFGSYVETSTNTLMIVSKKSILYTKAELLNTELNKTIISKSISPTDGRLDLNGIPTGAYLLILTNDAGNIDVEKIMIL